MSALPVIRARCRALAIGLIATLPAHAQIAAEAETPPRTAEPASPVTLAPVVVTGERNTSYIETSSVSGTKTDTPLMDTQQAVSVINREQLDAQGVLSVQDALRYSAGVRSDAYGIDSRSDDAFIRGTSFTQYLDGLRQYFGFFSVGRTDPYTLERLEVVRGPASVLFGQGTTGGLISLVSKRPLSTPRHEVELQLGNYARQQLAFDFTGPLSKNGVWSYRLVGLAREADAQLDFSNNDRRLLQPSLCWQPSADTRWTVIGSTQRDGGSTTLNFLPHEGTLLPNPNGRIPTSLFPSEPGFDAYISEQQSVTSLFEHRFDKTWSVAQNLRYSTGNVDYRTLYPDVFSNPDNPFLDADRRTVARYSYIGQDKSKVLVSDSRAEARFHFAGLSHRLLAGVDVSRSDNDSARGNGFEASPFDLYAPVYGNFTVPEVMAVPGTATTQAGVYLQDQLELDHSGGPRWVGTLGVRRDRATTEVEGSDKIKDSATTARAGVMYRFASGVHPYLSYSESFQPFTYTDFFGNPYKPLRGKQTEFGVKVQPAGSKSLITATLFDVREQNRLSPDPTEPFNSIQRGDAKSRGAELEASAQIARDLNVTGSYTYTDVTVSDGSLVAGLPLHQASVWGSYKFSLLEIPGFNLGGGLRYIGQTTDETGALVTPDLALIDAAVGYTRGAWTLGVNAANLEDKTYVATCLSRGDCFYGPRRSVVGRVVYRW
ncbi:MAG: TonB-dependent siderophore receptor [Stagnimonas sp.]|nr:TonB-dependent siderophore receptor [Stagnimonas sp.]